MRFPKLLLWVGLAAAQGAATSEPAKPASYLCLADQATGFTFVKETSKWRKTEFSTNSLRFVIRRDADSIYRAYFFGRSEKPGDNVSVCDYGFTEGNLLICKGLLDLVMSAETKRFTVFESFGYVIGDRLGGGRYG